MSNTVTLIVGHRLGKAEAVRHLKEGLARSNGQLGPIIAVKQETWQGDIEAFEESLRIDVTLPWLLAKAAKRLLPILRKQATLLLEKK